MFGLEILDIGIGLIFIYLVLSLMCTAANEFIANLTNARARLLQKGVRRLFEDTGFADDFKLTGEAQHGAQAASHGGDIIHDQDANGRHVPLRYERNDR